MGCSRSTAEGGPQSGVRGASSGGATSLREQVRAGTDGDGTQSGPFRVRAAVQGPGAHRALCSQPCVPHREIMVAALPTCSMRNLPETGWSSCHKPVREPATTLCSCVCED